jgi:hypothetical protein
MIRKILSTVILVIVTTSIFAQQLTQTIRGTITDNAS